ncbi:MAG: hypothetical protein HYR73_07125 [Candidatus Eisenbacteria bacterium]|nr:hypothetical protein [Candidatus Eisenbacteria bacterium]
MRSRAAILTLLLASAWVAAPRAAWPGDLAARSDTVRASVPGDRAATSDTVRARFEFGAGADVSNEIFYEDDVDTTFLRHRLVSTPEAQLAGVLAWELDGTRGGRETRYHVRNDLRAGNLVQTELLELHAGSGLDFTRRLDLESRLGWRHDQSFGRNLTEWRADGFGRMRSPLGDGDTHVEAGGRWDFGRSSGPSAGLIPDRNAGGGWIALDHTPITGVDGRVGYSLIARAYPDSTMRDHFEHAWEARARDDPRGAGWLEFESTGERRVTMRDAPTSRDQFLDARASVDGRVRFGRMLAGDGRFEGEWFRYDHPDSVLYFDYDVWRAALDLRFDRLATFAASIGPRVQWLRSPLSPAEAYDEGAIALELEWLARSAWWNVAPAFGRRRYRLGPTGRPFEDVGIHSPYWFVEAGLFCDQSLGAGWRLRASGTARDERHDDASQNAQSLYFSLDIRRLF